MTTIFISYSDRDAQLAEQMAEWLKDWGYDHSAIGFDKHAGVNVGDNWEANLHREMQRSQGVILILTQNWTESKWCFGEFLYARAQGKAIFPIVFAPLGDGHINSSIPFIDLTQDRTMGLEYLRKTLAKIAYAPPEGFSSNNNRPAFPGLASFEEEDAGVFFGRDDEIQSVIERLNASRSLGGVRAFALSSEPGVGCSSLLKAGILSRLRRDNENWIVLPAFRPHQRPVDEFAKSIAQFFGDLVQWKEWAKTIRDSSVEEFLDYLTQKLRDHVNAHNAHILIPVDRAEELFTISDEHSTTQFLQIMKTALQQNMPYFGIFAIRSGHVRMLQDTEAVWNNFEEIKISPLPLNSIEKIIYGPAHAAGLEVEDGLVNEIVNDAQSGGSLPLLAVTLRALFDRDQSSGKLSLLSYKALGNSEAGKNPLENAITAIAEGVISQHEPSSNELDALRDALVRKLVQLGPYRDYEGRPMPLEQLPSKADSLVSGFVEALLLNKTHMGNVRFVEVTHDALFRHWDRLKRWLEEENTTILQMGRQSKGDGTLYLPAPIQSYSVSKKPRKSLHLGKKLGKIAASLVIGALAGISGYYYVDQRSQQNDKRVVGVEVKNKEVAAVTRHKVKQQSAKNLNKSVKTESAQDRQIQGKKEESQKLKDVREKAVKTITRLQAKNDRTSEALNVARQDNAGLLAQLADWHSRFGDPVIGMLLAFEVIEIHKKELKGKLPINDVIEKSLYRALVRQGQFPALEGHTDSVTSAAFNSDGSKVLTTSRDGTSRIWKTKLGRLEVILKGHDGSVYSGAFGSNGRRIVTASEDKTARIWNANNGRELHVLEGHNDAVYRAAYSPDGEKIVTASHDKTAIIWDGLTGEKIRVLNGHDAVVWSAAFSPDNTKIVTASEDRTVRIWSVDTGAAITTLKGHDKPVYYATFSPDGERIATASHDKTIKIWDAKTGKVISTLRGHKDIVMSAAFNKDGQLLVTASFDNTARVWDAKSGEQRFIIDKHKKGVLSAKFSPDSKSIITASEDGTARILRIYQNTNELMKSAKANAPRCLTVKQRKEFHLNPELPKWCSELRKKPYN